MSMFLKRWRHKRSPAARRGRKAANAWMAKQQALTQGGDVTAASAKR